MSEDAPATTPSTPPDAGLEAGIDAGLDTAPAAPQPEHEGGAEPPRDADGATASEAAPDAAPADAPERDKPDEHDNELAALKERVAALEHEVEAEREHGTDYMRKWQQAQADFANFRRRAQQEQEQFAAQAAAQAMALVLPALDSFERAFKTLPESLARLTWIEGIMLVNNQLWHALELHGVEPFEPKPGDALDPTRHQAVAHAETTAHPEGSVVEVVQRGYALHGRALRPALVRVARAPAAGPAASGEAPVTETEPPGESGPAPPGDAP